MVSLNTFKLYKLLKPHEAKWAPDTWRATDSLITSLPELASSDQKVSWVRYFLTHPPFF